VRGVYLRTLESLGDVSKHMMFHLRELLRNLEATFTEEAFDLEGVDLFIVVPTM
jgi:hypothetical protein